MKYLIALLSFFALNRHTDTLLIIDKELKKPVWHADDFTPQDYLKRTFPVYASEVEALIAATDKAVKEIDKGQLCHNPINFSTAHTTIAVNAVCDGTIKIDVTLITQIEGSANSFSYTLVRGADDERKVQRRLLDFATYLNP